MRIISDKEAEKFDELVPFDLVAERALIGSMMLGEVADVAEMRTMVNRADIFDANHRAMFDAICHLHDDGKRPEAVLVSDYFLTRKMLSEIGGTAYIADIIGSVPSAAHGPHYAKIVKEKSKLRAIIDLTNKLQARAYGPLADDGADAIVEDALKTLGTISAEGKAAEFHTIGEIVTRVYDQLDKRDPQAFVTTGIPALDRMVGGIGRGEMAIVAGRPSMGKSLLAKNMARGMAGEGVSVALFSLEERHDKIGRNLLSAETSIENNKFRSGNLPKEMYQDVANGVARLAELPIYVCDRARRMRDIRAVAAMLVARHGVRAIIIDYLQRIQIEGKDRYEKVTNTSLAVSDMLKDLDVAGVVLAQLNRAVGGRDDKRPTMFDLRESGQIEQDADAIVMIHREDYYNLENTNYIPNNTAELIIEKWRDSVRGKTIRLRSELRYQRFGAEVIL